MKAKHELYSLIEQIIEIITDDGDTKKMLLEKLDEHVTTSFWLHFTKNLDRNTIKTLTERGIPDLSVLAGRLINEKEKTAFHEAMYEALRSTLTLLGKSTGPVLTDMKKAMIYALCEQYVQSHHQFI